MNVIGMAYIVVSLKTQNTIQVIFLSTSYIVLKGDKATHFNPQLKLDTIQEKEGKKWLCDTEFV